MEMVYVGSELECPLCGLPMDDEEGEVHWFCAIMEQAWSDWADSEVQCDFFERYYEVMEREKYG